MAKLHYERESNLTKKFSMAITLFDEGMFLNPTQAAATIESFLSQYPTNGDPTDKPRIEKHRTWSGSNDSDNDISFSAGASNSKNTSHLSTLQMEAIETAQSSNIIPRKSSGSGSEDSKESDPSSQGRESFVSLTSATLRRTLKNYWRAKEIGVVVQDEILCSLWNKSIVGKTCSSEFLEQAIAFFPLELALLWDRETQVVTAFDIGKSHAIEIRDLTEAEKIRYTVIIHNHPHGDTFSLEDLVLCANKGAKEVRAVTISCESPETMALKAYRCEMLDLPGFDAKGRMKLLNAVYLYFRNGGEIDEAFDRARLAPDTLRYRENQFSVLEQVGLVNFQESCDHTYVLPTKDVVLQWFQNKVKCEKRGLNEEERDAALRYLAQ